MSISMVSLPPCSAHSNDIRSPALHRLQRRPVGSAGDGSGLPVRDVRWRLLPHTWPEVKKTVGLEETCCQQRSLS
ncbi:unnamed protein product [Caretta caretta]